MKKLLALLFALLAAPVGAQVIPSGPFGSINYWGPSGSSVNLVPGLAGFCLTSGGTGQPVAWQLCPGATLASLPSINTNQFYGNVSGNFQAPIGVDVNTILNTVGYDIARPPAVESILYKSNVGPAFNWQTLPPSTQGSILTSGGPTNPPFWSPTPTQSNLASICQTVGALLYFDTPSLLWKCLSPGTSGQLLQTGGAAGNPSWLTVTLATLGGVPSTRNVNTTAPLGGGGALSSDLTLTCATCATTTNGGALSATSPVTISAAGSIGMVNQGTTTTVLHGNAAGNPSFGAVSLSTDASGTLQAAQMPALTGDVTTTAGSLATSYANVVPASKGGAGTITGALRGNGAGVVTQAAMADISDYLVGTWTPVLTGTTVAGSCTYGTQTGSYERIGRQVTLRFNVATSACGTTPTGNLTITGLPVTSASGENGECFFGSFGGWTGGAGYTTISGFVTTASAIISVFDLGSGKAIISTPTTEITFTASNIQGFCSYHT